MEKIWDQRYFYSLSRERLDRARRLYAYLIYCHDEIYGDISRSPSFIGYVATRAITGGLYGKSIPFKSVVESLLKKYCALSVYYICGGDCQINRNTLHIPGDLFEDFLIGLYGVKSIKYISHHKLNGYVKNNP